MGVVDRVDDRNMKVGDWKWSHWKGTGGMGVHTRDRRALNKFRDTHPSLTNSATLNISESAQTSISYIFLENKVFDGNLIQKDIMVHVV